MTAFLFSSASSGRRALRKVVVCCYLKAFSISLSLCWMSFGRFSGFSVPSFFLEVRES